MRSDARALRVIMFGMRGFPDVQGGIEKHAEQLCPLLQHLGCDVEVIVRARYVHPARKRWNGVRLLRVWCPKSRSLETIVHSFLAVLIAACRRPDIVHIHAIGPAIVVPLARLLGLHVVVTHHGADYDREKWGALGKLVLRAGETCGMRLAHQRIAVSKVIKALVRAKHNVDCEFIPNGIDLPELPSTKATLDKFGLIRGKYVLMVSRLVPEKRHADLIVAFKKASLKGWKLVLVGGADHRSAYAQTLTTLAAGCGDITMTGVQTGLALQELYVHAGLFVLPSSHEGLPIALLEALGYGLPTIASDIPANLEIGLDNRHYFPTGDINALADRLRLFAETRWPPEARQDVRQCLAARQNWHSVAKGTLNTYRQAAQSRRRFFQPHIAAHKPSTGGR
jgi:glycosyltransferase involved in cell wall biosynthesis